MRRASLLGTTGLSPKEIAAECGFRDAPQLTRSFARCFGVSPRGYWLLRADLGGTKGPT
jgi:transcriptional regulator GlxA family with amidase domain